MFKQNEEDHRYVDLDVLEVSLVDTPANEEEWLVVKRKGDDMHKEDEIKDKKVDVEDKAAKEKDIKKSESPTPSQPEMPIQFDNEKLNEIVAKAVEDQLKDLNVKKQEVDALDEFADEFTVEKAKGFTPKRMSAICDSVKSILNVLKDVDPEITKGLFASLLESAPAKKSKDDDEVLKRLTALEAQMISTPKSDSSDQSATVQKSKDMWASSIPVYYGGVMR